VSYYKLIALFTTDAQSVALVSGMCGLVAVVTGLMMGGFKDEMGRKTLIIGLGLFLFGVLLGNGFLE